MRRDYAGLAAVILAACLGLGWCVSIIVSATPWTDQISDAGAELLNGIGQVLAGALAAFLGSAITRSALTKDDLPPRVSPPPERHPTTPDDTP